MKISILILNWNRPQDTVAAIESCLMQKYDDFEIIVWDNASTDRSGEVLRERFAQCPKVRIHVADSNYGVAGGRNRAFAMAAGEILLSLDSDAVFESGDALANVAARLEADSAIGAISFEVKRSDGHLMWPFSRPAAEWRHKEFETIRVDGCAFATRREVFKKVGGFASHFSPYGAEDQHYAFNIIGHGWKVFYFPVVVVVHAFTPNGRTPLQFQMHVRNMLWTCMELFPGFQSFWGALKLAIRLFRDSWEQRQTADFFLGCFSALFHFSFARRRPMNRPDWKRFRALVNEDRRHVRASSVRAANI